MLSNYSPLWQKIAPRQEKTFAKIEYSIINSSPVDRDVLHCLKNTSDRLTVNEISQTRIANLTGHSYSAVNKSVARLTKKKLISKKFRFKKTCIYTVNKFFYEKDNWRRLLYLFKKARPLLNPILLRSTNITNRKNLECQQRYSKFVSYKFSCLYLYNRLDYNKETYNGESSSRHVGEYMAEAKKIIDMLLTPTIREMTKRFNLTKAGQIAFMAYPELVLKQSLSDLDRNKNVLNPVSWLLVRLRNYCKEHDIEINWKPIMLIRDAYKISPDAPFFFKSPQREVVKDSRPVKSHPLLEKSYPVRTEAPKENPHDVIALWEGWIASPIFPKASAIAGAVWPHITQIVLNREVDDAEIERLYAKYPFLKAHLDEVIARRLANPERADYTGSVREAIDTMLGVVHETVHTERRASPTPSFASAAQGDGFTQETEPGLCDRFGESARWEPVIQGTFDFGS